MAKIIRADEIIQRPGIQLEDPNAAAGPSLANVRAGERVQQASARLAADAQQSEARERAASNAHARFTQATQEASRNAKVNDRLSAASVAYSKAITERLSKQRDKDGKPTYDKIEKDAHEIFRQIRSQFGAGLNDSLAAKKFGRALKEFHRSNLPGILSEARKQQVDFTRASTLTTLNTLTAAAGSDKLGNYKSYEQQYQGVLRDAIADGSMSAEEAVKLQEGFRRTAALGNINAQIAHDPGKAMVQLANARPEDIGLTQPEYNKATEYAAQAFAERKEAEEKQAEQERKEKEREAEAERRDKVDEIRSKAALAIANGNASEAYSALSRGRGVLNEAESNYLEASIVSAVKQQDKAAAKEHAKRSRVYEISARAASGMSLVGATGKEKDAAFNQLVNDRMQAGQDRISAMFQVRSSMNTAEVGAFTEEVHASLFSDDPTVAVHTAQALEQLAEDNPLAYSELPEKTRMLGVQLMRSTGLGQVPGDAAKNVQKQATMPTDMKVAVRASTVNKVVDRAIDGAFLDIKDFSPASVLVDKTLRTEVEELTRQALIMSKGNEDEAEEYVAKALKGKVGDSDVTAAMERGMAATATRMYMPPENFAYGMAEPEDVQEVLRKSLEMAATPYMGIIKDVDRLVYTYHGPTHTGTGGIYKLGVVGDDGEVTPLIDPNTEQQAAWAVGRSMFGSAVIKKKRKKK